MKCINCGYIGNMYKIEGNAPTGIMTCLKCGHESVVFISGIPKEQESK